MENRKKIANASRARQAPMAHWERRGKTTHSQSQPSASQLAQSTMNLLRRTTEERPLQNPLNLDSTSTILLNKGPKSPSVVRSDSQSSGSDIALAQPDRNVEHSPVLLSPRTPFSLSKQPSSQPSEQSSPHSSQSSEELLLPRNFVPMQHGVLLRKQAENINPHTPRQLGERFNYPSQLPLEDPAHQSRRVASPPFTGAQPHISLPSPPSSSESVPVQAKMPPRRDTLFWKIPQQQRRQPPAESASSLNSVKMLGDRQAHQNVSNESLLPPQHGGPYFSLSSSTPTPPAASRKQERSGEVGQSAGKKQPTSSTRNR